MKNFSTDDWKTHHALTKDVPPSKLLLRALEYVSRKNRAIDVGAGALRDTRLLLSEGFEVVALDKEDTLVEFAAELDSPKLTPVVTDLSYYEFGDGLYDLVNAMYMLPFVAPDNFLNVVTRIKKSLKQGGVFCGNFFGPLDEWSARTDMTFCKGDQVKELFHDMEILVFDDIERDNPTATGAMKHWHVISVIARKN